MAINPQKGQCISLEANAFHDLPPAIRSHQ